MRGIRIAAKALLRYKWRITLALALILAIAIGAYLLLVYERQAPRPAPALSVSLDQLLVGTIDHTLLDSAEGLSVVYEDVSYAAVPLGTVLEKIDALPTSQEVVVCLNERGDVLPIQGIELVDPGAVYLAYRRGGMALTERQGGPYLLLVFHMDGTSEAMPGVTRIRIEPQE